MTDWLCWSEYASGRIDRCVDEVPRSLLQTVNMESQLAK